MERSVVARSHSEGFMELDLKQELHLLQKQVEANASFTADMQRNLLAAIDSVKIEIEILRRVMKRFHPDFARHYAALKEEVLQEVDPEWIEPRVTTKTA